MLLLRHRKKTKKKTPSMTQVFQSGSKNTFAASIRFRISIRKYTKSVQDIYMTCDCILKGQKHSLAGNANSSDDIWNLLVER